MNSRPHLRQLLFFVQWEPQTRLFRVYLDDKLVGSHRGRGGADGIGRKAVDAKRLAAKRAMDRTAR